LFHTAHLLLFVFRLAIELLFQQIANSQAQATTMFFGSQLSAATNVFIGFLSDTFPIGIIELYDVVLLQQATQPLSQ
jgi:hypothetical protein